MPKPAAEEKACAGGDQRRAARPRTCACVSAGGAGNSFRDTGGEGRRGALGPVLDFLRDAMAVARFRRRQKFSTNGSVNEEGKEVDRTRLTSGLRWREEEGRGRRSGAVGEREEGSRGGRCRGRRWSERFPVLLRSVEEGGGRGAAPGLLCLSLTAPELRGTARLLGGFLWGGRGTEECGGGAPCAVLGLGFGLGGAGA